MHLVVRLVAKIVLLLDLYGQTTPEEIHQLDGMAFLISLTM
jgi:hypothetical protein